MKRRELSYLVSGLIVGVILGVLLQEAVLGGTAGSKAKATNYYVVELDTTESWLVKAYPSAGEKVQTALRAISPSNSIIPSGAEFVDVADDAAFLMQQTYGALLGVEDTTDLKISSKSETSLCLTLDEDPYEGSTVYLYLSVPADEAKGMDIPEEWQKLDKPKTNELYWQILACFPEIK
ncbi:MAG: hypothetical protein JXA10_08695 [Anaerolineae bacterium]|nr:hypothetical protein [Anaerolineae bacterium]